MGNKILGKRSRSFYKGFNQSQINYIKQKFSTLSKDGFLDKNLFIQAYQINETLCSKFFAFVDFDESNQLQEYEFICAVHSLCNMTIQELGSLFFNMCNQKENSNIKQKDLLNFTQSCIKYNYYLQKKEIPKAEQISKINKKKFTKYDFDKNKQIDRQEFIKICLKDQDYKKWMFNMGFLTKKQLQFQNQVYDLVDSDIQGEIDRHLNQSDPNVSKIKRGIEHRLDDDQFAVAEQKGQQSVSQKMPWIKSVQKFGWSDKFQQNLNSPSQTLQMSYVFGYRSFDCRNNLKFDSIGNIVYHQAAVGIVMKQNKKEKKSVYSQSYITEHRDDITCLDVAKNIAVTGQVGSKPMILLWETDQVGVIQPKLIITRQLEQSVGNVCISGSTRYLAANCNDLQHTLVVYDIKELYQIQKQLTSKKTGIVVSGPLTKHIIFDLKFSVDEKMIVAATLKELIFINFQNKTLNSDRGDFNNFSNSPALCLLPLAVNVKGSKMNYMLSGMANGSIYFWDNQKCVKALCGHSGSVSALAKRQSSQSFISGDKSGKIIVWNQKLQKEKTYMMPKTNSPSNMIVALSCNSQNNILIGTKNATVYKLKIGDSIQNAEILMEGHSQGNINALAVNQSQKQKNFFTGGDDMRLIKWQYGQFNRKIIQKKLTYKIRSIDFNNGRLVVGYQNGVVQLFDENIQKQNIVFSKIKNPDQEALNIVKVSPKDKTIAVSYTFPKYQIKILQIDEKNKNLKQIFAIQKQQKIIAFDFDVQGKYLRINTSGFKFSVHDIQTKQEIKQKDSKSIKNVAWATHNTFLSPQTQGFLTQGVSQTDITFCQRNRYGKNVFVLGDKYSKIKLFNYPCKKNQIFNKYNGHSNQVTAMQFNNIKNDEYLISVGGEQKSIIVWKYDPDQVNNGRFMVIDEQKKQVQNDEFAQQQQAGEQAGSTNHYKGQIFPPSDFRQKYNPKRDNKQPKQSISIHHVFGLRNKYLTDEVRNQCKFTKDFQNIIFPTACLGVKMNIKTRDQQFYLQHKQDIVSLAVDSKRQLMATGQMAEKNLKSPKDKILAIYIWDIQSKTVLKKLDGFHTIAVVLLEFSPSSKLLFSVGNDNKNTFAVYDWRSGAILYSGPVSQGKVNGICWKSETQFLTCGNDHVKLWSNGKGIQAKFDTGQKPEPMFCCTSSQNVYITGSGSKKDGFIYNWVGGRAKTRIQAHKGKIQALIAGDRYVYSGGDDGVILQWTKQKNGQIQKKQRTFDTRQAYSSLKVDVNTMHSEQFGVLSIDFYKDNKVLIATKGASVILWDRLKKNSQIIHYGHYQGQLWGLTTKNDEQIFVTGGDDKTVRIWSIKNKRQESRVYFDNKVRGLDFQKSGRIVVADFQAKLFLLDSNLKVLDQYTGKPYQTSKKSKLQPWVQDIKFSPDSKFLAYGTHAKSRQLQFVKVQGNKLKLHKTFNGGSSALLHLDWSRNSDSISVNTQAYEYYFFGLDGKDQRASSLNDQKWATWTKKLGFPVQGIFQGADLTDVNTVCRSPDSEYIAVGYDDQTIRLFKYPCYIPRQTHKTFYGHSSHITRIRFCKDYMISTGGEDKTIIIWNIDSGKQQKSKKRYGDDEQSDGLQDLDEDVDLPNKAIAKKKVKPVIEEFHLATNEGDQFMAVKPWLGAIKQPSYEYPLQTVKPPKAQIKLQYVFGYRTKDCRQNLFYVDKQTILYHAAAVLIYHDTQKNEQNLLAQHNDDILSIDFNKKTGRVVTGELGPKPFMNFYENGKLIQKFKAPVTKGILSVSLSPDGNFAVCVGMDQNHEVCVIDLKRSAVVGKQKGGKKVILKAKWVNNNEFVTIGINHYRYWTFQKSLKFKQSKEKGNFVSIDINEGVIITGANKGSVHSWKQNQKKKQSIIYLKKQNSKGKEQEFQASIIQSIKILQQNVLCGTKDGYIVVLDKNLDKIKQFDMQKVFQYSQVPSENCGIRSIDYLNSKIILGTFGAQIYQVNYQQGLIKQKTCRNILKCHYSPNNTWTNQVWGLAIQNDNIYTCSDDATVRSWSLADRKLTSCTSLNTSLDISKQQTLQMDKKTRDFVQTAKGRSVAVSPDGLHLVVGSKDGTVRIYQINRKNNSLKNVQNFKHAKQWISDIKFGFNTLIIGSHDNKIYVYDFQNGEATKKYRPLHKHSSYITHIDVSRDSCYLQSTCGAYEILFWDINSGKQLTSGATMLKDERWMTWTCNLGWPVQGIYPKCTDGTFINSVDRSNLSINNTLAKDDQKSPYLLASGNDNGKVSLYNYPCTIKSSNSIQGVGHSSHVTNVRWSVNDKYLISVGGQDQCMMVWKVDKNK